MGNSQRQSINPPEQHQQIILKNLAVKECMRKLQKQENYDAKDIVFGQNGLLDTHLSIISKQRYKQLQSINLYKNNIQDNGLYHIIKQYGDQMKKISAEANKITYQFLFRLMSEPKNIILQRLDLRSNRIRLGGQAHSIFSSLSKSDLSSLLYLNLSHNQIGAIGCEILSKIQLSHLMHLQMDNCRINNQGFKNLSKISAPLIAKLNLGNNHLSLYGLTQFIRNSNLKELKFLYIESKSISYGQLIQLILCCFKSHQFHYTLYNLDMGESFLLGNRLTAVEQNVIFNRALLIFSSKYST